MASDAALTYYDGPDLVPTVLEALRAAGRSVDRLDPDDLAALDEFHALGRPATLALADLASVQPGERVLDVGAGIGGPSRVLARHYGAEVVALDPTARFCRLNEVICERSSLAERVTVTEGDARDLPFADASFDVVWTQAVLQSVADKARVAHEIRRVLKPGGRLALFEIVAGPGGELHFPVPWADGPEQSFIVSEPQLRGVLADAGFTDSVWNRRPEIQASIQQAVAENDAMASGHADVTLALVMPDFAARMAGLARNVQEDRIDMVQAVMTAG
jgi:SAM-dependent methyltransferase